MPSFTLINLIILAIISPDITTNNLSGSMYNTNNNKKDCEKKLWWPSSIGGYYIFYLLPCLPIWREQPLKSIGYRLTWLSDHFLAANFRGCTELCMCLDYMNRISYLTRAFQSRVQTHVHIGPVCSHFPHTGQII